MATSCSSCQYDPQQSLTFGKSFWHSNQLDVPGALPFFGEMHTESFCLDESLCASDVDFFLTTSTFDLSIRHNYAGFVGFGPKTKSMPPPFVDVLYTQRKIESNVATFWSEGDSFNRSNYT
jgi:hypothetical protein